MGASTLGPSRRFKHTVHTPASLCGRMFVILVYLLDSETKQAQQLQDGGGEPPHPTRPRSRASRDEGRSIQAGAHPGWGGDSTLPRAGCLS